MLHSKSKPLNVLYSDDFFLNGTKLLVQRTATVWTPDGGSTQATYRKSLYY